MKGTLVKIYNSWMVAYLDDSGYHIVQLHPDDAEVIEQERYIDDVNFEIVSHQKLTGIARYAKLTSQ